MTRHFSETAAVAHVEGSRLAVDAANQIEVGHFNVPKLGMHFPRQLSYERWKIIGHQLSTVSKWSAWCLGDWIVHGEENYSGRYRDAIDQSGLDYQTLRNYAWVARRFDLSRRRDTLSLAHHAEVASLPEPEQDFWLRKAEESRWSRNRLRKEVRASLAERAVPSSSDGAGVVFGVQDTDHDVAGDEEVANRVETRFYAGSTVDSSASPPRPGEIGGRIQVVLSVDQMQSCQAAADRVGCTIEEWASSVLDHAACNF